MPRENNIFHNLVVYENDCTELFCNLLALKVFRDAVLDLIGCGHLKSNITSTDLSTQVYSAGGRPDIEISGDGYKILIEVKTGTNRDLTSNQRSGYGDIFSDCTDDWRSLVFVAPKNYQHANEIRQSVIPELEKQNPPVNANMVTWEDIISLIERNELDTLSPFLDQFAALLRDWYVQPEVTFGYAEIKMLYSSDLAKALKKLRDTVDSVQAETKGFSSQRSSPRNQSEYGVYFKKENGKKVLFFGIWNDFWEQHGCPLCLAVDNIWASPVSERLKSPLYSKQVLEFKGWTVLPVPEDWLASDSAPARISAYVSELLD